MINIPHPHVCPLTNSCIRWSLISLSSRLETFPGPSESKSGRKHWSVLLNEIEPCTHKHETYSETYSETQTHTRVFLHSSHLHLHYILVLWHFLSFHSHPPPLLPPVLPPFPWASHLHPHSILSSPSLPIYTLIPFCPPLAFPSTSSSHSLQVHQEVFKDLDQLSFVFVIFEVFRL